MPIQLEAPFAAEVCSLYGIKEPVCSTNESFQFLKYLIEGQSFEVLFNNDHNFHSSEYRRVELLLRNGNMRVPVRDVYIAAGFIKQNQILHSATFTSMQNKAYQYTNLNADRLEVFHDTLIENSGSSRHANSMLTLAKAIKKLRK